MSQATMSAVDFETVVHREVAKYYADPLGFVVAMYPWPIKGQPGPDNWQREELEAIGRQVRARRFGGTDPVIPIRRAWSTGQGIGKSALLAWLVIWIMSTRPHAHGTVTANTNDQLDLKTWAAVREWTALCLTSHWWEINGAIMYRKGCRPTWFCAPQSCKEENSDAFQGQHARDSTSFYVVDEGSGVGTAIYEAAEGGLTDGEPMIFVAGNCLRSSGEFYRITHGNGRDLWGARVIDARTTHLANKALIQQWAEQYGEDSDFFRVRVRGLPPRASSLNFIDEETVAAAQRRTNVLVLPDEPLVVGVDFADGGNAWNVVRFRRGADARSIPPIRVKGEDTRESRSGFLALLASLLADRTPARRVAMMFCDSAFGAPYVERLKTMGYTNVQEIRFGDTTTPVSIGGKPIHHMMRPGEVLEVVPANMRAYMWQKGKEWLRHLGSIDPNDTKLAADFVGPSFHLNRSDNLVIESKADMTQRGCASPDDGDAHNLTFAAPVLHIGKLVSHPHARRGRFEGRRSAPGGGPAQYGWMGLWLFMVLVLW